MNLLVILSKEMAIELTFLLRRYLRGWVMFSYDLNNRVLFVVICISLASRNELVIDLSKKSKVHYILHWIRLSLYNPPRCYWISLLFRWFGEGLDDIWITVSAFRSKYWLNLHYIVLLPRLTDVIYYPALLSFLLDRRYYFLIV